MSSRDDSKVAFHEFGTTDLQTFLDNFGSKLVDAVVVGICKNVVDHTAFVRWGTMLTQMLDTPVAKLTVSDEVNAPNDFLDGWTLNGEPVSIVLNVLQSGDLPFPPQHSSQICSAQPSCLSLLARLHATCHEEPR